MALIDKLRKGVAKANSVINTKGHVGVTVWLIPWISSDLKGKNAYGSRVPVTAIFEAKTEQYYTAGGQLIQQVGTLTILVPVTPNGAAGRQEPIDPRDIFVLDDGVSTSPILNIDNVLKDSGTGKPLMHTVELGRIVGGA